MKDNIANVGNVLRTELVSQTSKNITNVSDNSQQAQNVKNILQVLTPSELFWYERLTSLQPFQLPFETAGEQVEPKWAISVWCSPLPGNGEEDPLRLLLQAFAIYLARLTHQTEFQIGWCVDEVKETPNMLAGLVPVVPMTLEVAFDKPWGVVADWIDDELARLVQHRTFSRDLLSYFPDLQVTSALTTNPLWRIAVSVIKNSKSGEQDALGELLTLQIDTQGGFRWIYDENRLSTENIQQMSEHLQVLALSKKMDDEIPVRQLNLLPEAERTLLLETWNATKATYPDQLCIHQLIEQQVEKAPESPALVYENQTLSYGELNACANRLAHQLIALGVKPDQRVAICMASSPARVVGLLAVLKAGGAYVPLDPAYSGERLSYLLTDAAPAVVLADSTGRGALGGEALSGLTVLDPNTLPDLPDSNPQVPGLTARHLAYVIYTSGSTGMPKGVMVEHRGVINLALAQITRLDIRVTSRMLQFASFSFDASVWEIMIALGGGASLVIPTDAVRQDLRRLWHYLEEQAVTHACLTPALLREGADLPAITIKPTLVLAGEAASTTLIQALREKVTLFNAYGPTEITVCATTWRCPSDYTDTLVPIGRPMTNTRIYLLDVYGQPVPLGVIGELYVGGDGVARGYFNRPELTAERFLADPFSNEPGARMYRTGDLARYRPDGNLEFLGRNDQQVKIRGFRIEPGEIEARLVEYPAVREAVVLALGEGQDKQLVAYVLTHENDGLAVRLREHLRARLPDYMVPVAFVSLEKFPLTLNGKLDRRALPAPGVEAFARQVYVAPQGEMEIALATLWRELLGIEPISRHDSFFALGGHSLLGVRMIERLHSLGLTLTARDLFQCPILSELAQILRPHQVVGALPNVITLATTALTPVMLPLIDLTQSEIDHIIEQVPGGIATIQDIYALSPLQDGILFHHLLAREGDPYLLTCRMVFADRELLDRYLAAMQYVVDRHDILRTAFIWQGLSAPAQVVWRQALLSVTELTLDLADGPVGEQLAHRFDPRQYRFDLNQAPLLRFVIAPETDGRWQVLQLLHHLIGDRTTMEVMHREVWAYLAGQSDNLPVPTPFRNLVAEARLGVSQAEHTRFFTDMLADVDEPTLPFGLIGVHCDGSQITQSYRMLSPVLNDRLRQQAKCLGVSLATLCHLAWAQVLSRTSGQEKVVFGTVLFGRMQVGEGADSGMGLFINTLPLRLDIDDTPVCDSVLAVQSRLAWLLGHEHASLAQAQRCSGVQGESPLFSALLNYRHNEQVLAPDKVIQGIEFLDEQERTNYPFVLSVEDGGSTLGLTAQAVQPLEPERVCSYMQQALESLVEALEQAPGTPVRALNILPETERTLLLETWNATETAYPEQLRIHQLFEQQVEKTPETVALIEGDQTLSYAELNTCANRLARQLIEQGVCPNEHVAMLLARSTELVVAQLAILKMGAVYVPVDLNMPDERKNWLISDCSAKLLLTNTRADIPADVIVPVLCLSDETDRSREEDRFNLNLPCLSSGAAYVMYTSGSTGTPKGVVVPHRAVVRLVINNGYAEIERDERVAFTANPAFDASTFEVWAPLLNGGTLVVIDHATLLTPHELVRALKMHHVTVLWLTIGLFNRLAAALSPVLSQIKVLIFGGDIPDLHVIAQVLDHHPPQQLLQAYGPSEGTTFTTMYPIEVLPQDVTRIPIGQPIANTRVYLLDADGQLVPLGVIGEIYVGGDGVADGYLNRPELTAERFLVDPFSDKPGARMYRTGDLARYLSDGNLEFLGRNDQQVKIRGFRIEPGEIEARLTAYPEVREAAVLALGEGQDKRLVAYVVAPENDGLAVGLRTYLSVILPDYMVPAAFVRLDAFPLTSNGKLDRRALPAPGEEAFARQVYEAPQGEMETVLAAIWRELLGVEQISRHDNFFALGGHSLLGIRLMNRIAAFGIELPLSTLFEAPALTAFAEAMGARFDKQSRLLPAILPISREGKLPLSFSQQRLWFLAQLDGVSDTYHIPVTIRLRGQVDIAAWQQALNALFARHEALRSVFMVVDGQPQVRLLAPDNGLPLSQHDLRGIPEAETVLERLSTEEVYTPFDLMSGPLIRAFLIRLRDDEYQFLLTQHHIISDGWSINVLIREFSTLYTAFLAKQPDPLPPLTIQYPDYAAWQRQWLSAEHTQIQSDYWRMMLADAPVLLDLPTDRPRPPEQSFVGNTLAVNLDAELTKALKRLSEQQGVTLFMTILSAWAAVLSRLSGQDDVVIGTPSAGRSCREVEPLIGFFVNTLALRIDLSGEPNVAELLIRARQVALMAQEHQDLPFEQVVEIVQPPRRLAHTPLFQVMFAWQNNERSEWELPGVAVSPVDQTFNVIKFDLELNLSEEEGRIVGYLDYSTALFDQSTIERHAGYLHTVLQAMVANVQQRIGEIDILAPAERRLLLEIGNATETVFPDPLCIHQLFEQQVEITPDMVALIYQEQTFSYAELNARTNRLAHQLIGLGVAPDQRVAICVSRSPAMVVGMLAVLKASGAYVPLDTAYPVERLAHILNDAKPAMVLVDEAGRRALGEDLLAGLLVLDLNTRFDQPDSNPQVLGLTPQHLAYVIYTSGSTGQPKGVMIEHQAIYQRSLGFNETYAVTAQDRVLQFSSFAFDASVEEFFSSLSHGATLVMRDDSWLASVQEFIALIRQHRITVMSLPTLFWSELAALPLPECLRLIIMGGEAVKKSAIQAWFAQKTYRPRLLNTYGPTENTVIATCKALLSPEDAGSIGRPVKNTCIYLLDSDGQPVPLGSIGEIYIGGVGVARGYLNRPELTAEHFLVDPFSSNPDARMYRSGDLARYLPDGNLEFLGRNDHQVKIRGFRIEPGEIEIRLMEYPTVQEAVVLALGEGQDKRLVAYVVAETDDELVNGLRRHLSATLPDYMIPSAFVRLDALPSTPNGKLDRRALPAPGEEAFARQVYEAPQGEIETALAAIWRELLGVEQISRHDNFFALGGHSLLVVRMIESLRRIGLGVSVQTLFQHQTLRVLAQSLDQHREIQVPENRITPDMTVLTPDLLPLINLTQSDIDLIAGQVPGGIANIQDIYALSPLQEGILFHHLLANEGDPYLLTSQMAFADRSLLDRYLAAVQQVIDRHDILRTAFIWRGLSVPAQVVWRHATLSVTELILDPVDEPISDQLIRRFDPRQHRIDLGQAPLLRFVIAQEGGRWILLEQQHHLIGDHTTLEVMNSEVQAHLTDQKDSLPAPVPFRNLVALARLGVSQEEHTRFFTNMLAEVDEPTLPFGLTEVHRDDLQMVEFHRMLTTGLNDRLRGQARCLGVSLAALCHLAWAQVLSRTSGQEKVVFGTVLFGRMQAGEGVDRGMGLFINTLPLRLDMDDTPVWDSVQASHTRLAGLLAHEHASLALAQRCSGVASGTPLFNALLNYRHNTLPVTSDEIISGIEFLGGQERTNYPFSLSVEDFGDALGLTAQVVQPLDPERICGYMQRTLESLVEALEQSPETPVRQLEILPETERTLLLKTWNTTEIAYSDALCLNQLFEQQVEKTPDATALEYQEHLLSYAELNARANRLAHQLITLGVAPDQQVAICVARSPAMVVGMLAVLKAGGAYIPLDTAYPVERLAYILNDAKPAVVLADEAGRVMLGEDVLAGLLVLDPNTQPAQPDNNPQRLGLTPQHLAYVIYTSGSTGQPKGVMVEHQAVYQRYLGFNEAYVVTAQDRVLQFSSFAFDASVEECFSSLCNGATMVMRDDSWLVSIQEFIALIRQSGITMMSLPTLFWSELAGRDHGLALPNCLRLIIIGGETVKKNAVQDWFTHETHLPRLLNSYGPTETTVMVTYKDVLSPEDNRSIGRPAKNSCVYLLDLYGQPVPLGCIGEMYIGGVGVARGYLNRPELSAERFVPDPFSPISGARMYRSGDLARYLPDGDLEFLGRNDHQVKIRGFRIEPGEIETRLMEYPAVQEAVVLALGEGQDKRLVAYVMAETDDELVNNLRRHLSAILPDYMVPAAFVRLDAFPSTPNGKLDRRALPAPGEDAFARQVYEVPQGEMESALAAVWRELLGVEQISRHDNFFALGGHSLLIVRMIESLRRIGLGVSVQMLFRHQTLRVLAQSLTQHREIQVPKNRITPDMTVLTPDLLPLINLTQTEIDLIVGQVPGGMTNIQDIYALSPLQEGILFHHLLTNRGDPYLLTGQMSFADRSLLDRYLVAVQQVVDRHDILRTAFIWQGLSVPTQVVWRQATLSVTELTLDPVDGPISNQLTQRFDPSQCRMDLGQAPLLRFMIAQEEGGRWILLEQQHHLIGDHSTMEVMDREVQAYLVGQEANLPAPAPFRNLVAQARLGMSQAEHTRFFTDMLAGVDEPTLSFGLTEVHQDGSQVTESYRMLTSELNDRLRNQARCLGVSLASLCHLAWAQVLSRTSGQEKVVFGTVLFGRMQAGEGADSGMGLFINTLPLRLDMDETPVRDSVQAAHTRLAGLLVHEHASLVLAQRCSGVASGTPLFNALLNYRHNTQVVISDELISGIEFLDAQERTNYPFALSVEDYGHALGLTAQVVQPFEPGMICGYMQQALESLVEALEQAPETPVRQLEILPEMERTLLLKTWNATETAYPDALCIHQLFEQQAEKTPDAMALRYKERTLSYAELNARANRLAHQLIALGVVRDQRVAICVSRSPAMVVGLLAVLKAGGAYVPLDPVYPGERLAHILIDAAPAILLADDIGRTALGGEGLATLTVLDPNILPDQPDSNPQVPTLTSRHLAYVIYTSGSTGIPKGVMVEHRGLVNLILDKIAQFGIGTDSRILQFISLGFDASVLEIMMALTGGATLEIPVDTIRQDPSRLWHYLEEQAITHACLTPALLRDGADLPVMTIRPTLILGGEAPSTALLQALCGRVNLFNDYGPTEITICATSWRCPSDYTGELSSIGRPTANTRLYLLDKYGQPVPLGAVGELYIGGAGVARGYLNRPELTAERFLVDPFSDNPDTRMYRTGDLARYRPDGNVEFLGRNDQQVKIRGFRIEPGEIETRLMEYPAVREAVVLVQSEEQDKRLVAYVVADVDDKLIHCLRTHLSAILPDYMVPSAFVRLDAFPLTPNGKLDSRALPVPDEASFARQVYEAPQGENEIALAAIWRELLGIEQISRYDNFFALGGHSLLAVRMMNRVAAFGVELSLSTLFAFPSLAAFADVMSERFDEQSRLLPAIMPISREGKLPLSFAQQRLWLLAQFEGVSETYHIPMAFRLRGQLNVSAWQQALDALFARHEALRSVFVSVDGQPQVELLPVELGLPMKKYDLREILDMDEQLKRLCAQEAEMSFDLARGPLIRSGLVQLANDDYVFLLTQHHIVSDGWSTGVLIGELNALYTAFQAGQPDPLPPLAIQYPDYAAWQRQWLSAGRTQIQSDYWRTMLADVPVLLDLPTDRPRPPKQMFVGNTLSVNLDAELTQALKHLSEQQGVTLFMTLLSAWAVVLSRLSGQNDVVIGTPSAGRNRQEVEPLLGFFVNTLVLRIDLSGTPNVAELLARVRHAALMAQEHQDLPFEQIVEIVQPPRRLAHTPLFQVMFALQNNERIEWRLPGLAVSPVDQDFDVVKFDLELSLSEEEGRIVGHFSYSTALFDQPTIERHVGYLCAVLQAMVTNVQQRIGEIDILAPAEHQLLLEIGNVTETAYPEPWCIHQLFEQQVEKNPGATALVYNEQTVSYAELNACANRLAHQLMTLGVTPDQRVAICVSRSPAMVVGLLAVLKAGGAYVPLDTAYPVERLTYILNDAAPVVVLADETGRTALGELALAGLTVLDPNVQLDQPDSNLLALGLTPQHLAYVMYTSGSTGRPKGVMVEHQAVYQRYLGFNDTYAVTEQDRVLQFASFAFDASVEEFFSSLSNGATLVMRDDSWLASVQTFIALIRQHRITVMSLPTLFWSELAALPLPECLRLIIMGGEAVKKSAIQAWFTQKAYRPRLLNTYGPTENTVIATCKAVLSPEDDRSIGQPVKNVCIYLLDPYGQRVPLGCTGEMYIGGIGVARGYLNRPELSAERFMPDPFSPVSGARMYRSGDLARYLPDGNLEFLGRNDHQIKIRGFRIEPGEIETRLMEYPTVQEAVVLALGEGQDKRLVAYVVAEVDDGLVNRLRSHLSAILPDYMVPAAFVRLDAFPSTPNGKLDRGALPAPGEEAFARLVYEAPQGEMETVLAAIWRELLGVEQISRHDNFFALGGHSLLAIRMINLATGRGLICTLSTLFQFPVLAELSAKITLDLLSQPKSSAISVRLDGTGLPLFFVPSGMGDYSYVFGLARQIQSGYPIYALPWSSTNESPMSTMEEQAARMIGLMKAVQPKGPYRVGGYSSGGILAYAIAERLLHTGERVNFLGLIDTPAPHYFGQQKVQPGYQFFAELARQLGEEYTEEMASLYRRIDELNLVQLIEAAQKLALYPANLRADLIAKRWEQIANYAQIVREYKPQILAITLHQFYAMEPSPAISFMTDEEPELLNIEPSLGWEQIIPDALLQLIGIPGNHFSVLEDNEHKTALAQALNRALAISCNGEAL
ncbi:non-ribosomal peptide synthetase [Photorhabdus temperata]|nr:non-ribosomal peptide synthetase [Photorhabdus temperata]